MAIFNIKSACFVDNNCIILFCGSCQLHLFVFNLVPSSSSRLQALQTQDPRLLEDQKLPVGVGSLSRQANGPEPWPQRLAEERGQSCLSSWS